MRKIFTLFRNCFLLISLLLSGAAYAQNVGINSSGDAPDASAGLDVSFGNKGLLIPRVTLSSIADVTTIPSPATSLLVYNTAAAGAAPNDVTIGFYYFNGSSWIKLSTDASSQWALNGLDLYYTGGKVGIGLTNPSKTLQVNGSSAINTSLNVDFSDASTGTLSGGLIFGAVTGEGITSKRTAGGNFKGLDFYTNDAKRLAITNSGNVGIGVTEPTYKLQIGAAANPLFLSGVQTGDAADSLLTITGGVVKKLAPFTARWNLTGNASAETDFLGTTNNQSLRIKTNNIQRFYIDSLGSVAIGTSPVFSTDTPRERLLIEAGGTQGSPLNGSTDGFTPLHIRGYSSKYFQFNLQNKHSGTNASTDIIATANNGSDTNFYVDLGINSSTNNKNYFGNGNDAYLYNLGQDFLIGTGTSGKNLQFLTGGGNESSNERMRITGSGIVSIASNNPQGSAKLYVNGETYSTILSIGTTSPNALYKLNVNGDAIATNFVSSSDRRLKKNIQGLNYGLKHILSLQPVTYNWIDTAQSTKTQIGLIAQDAKKVIPEIVNGDEAKEKLSINYIELVPVLINAMKEQQAKIDAQQKQIDELKALIKK